MSYKTKDPKCQKVDLKQVPHSGTKKKLLGARVQNLLAP